MLHSVNLLYLLIVLMLLILCLFEIVLVIQSISDELLKLYVINFFYLYTGWCKNWVTSEIFY